MERCSIPICYFPSMIIFISDRHNFMLNITCELHESVAYRLFDVPTRALEFIDNYRCEIDVIRQHCSSEYLEAQQFSTENHLAPLYAEVYNPYRFSEISVVVIDTAVLGIDSFEFCRELENSPIKKLMLVDETEEPRAIDALKQGLIDAYIKKQDLQIFKLIRQQIIFLQYEYFFQMSQQVTRLLSLTLPLYLYDIKFSDFFLNFRKKYDIIEYYLLDDTGRFLMLDQNANISMLIMKQVADMRQDDFSENDHVFERIFSNKVYYCAYITQKIRFVFQKQKILSYHQYLDELAAEELWVY